ncbi:MAG: sulfurtransferase [Gammaproteobacteria bacterium]|nr:sulfurtransferase [Gammaproteobacteria bacterium]
MKQITPKELQERLATPGDGTLVLLDVREPMEFRHAHIAGSVHIPMQDVPRRLTELTSDAETVVICHHGMRSAQVAGFLEGRGFTRVSNLVGGIDAWSLQVDPAVPRY